MRKCRFSWPGSSELGRDRSPVARLVRFQLEEATSAYENGGRPALQSFLDTLHRVYDAYGYEDYLYTGSPEPALSSEDTAWARQLVPAAR